MSLKSFPVKPNIHIIKFNSNYDARTFKYQLYLHYKNSFYPRFAERNNNIIKTNASYNQIKWILKAQGISVYEIIKN